MDVRQLRALVHATRAGSITEAARSLHYSQQAVSRQIAALERLLGVPLLVRSPDGVRATESGRLVVAAADRVLAIIDGLEVSRSARSPTEAGPRLRVGVHPPGGWRVMSSWIAALTAAGRARPSVSTTLWDRWIPDLTSGDLDLVFCYGPVELDDVEVTPLWTEPRLAWLRRDHPVAVGRTTIGLGEYLALASWDIPDAPDWARAFWCAYAERGGPPRFVDECRSLEDVLLTASVSDAAGLAPAGLTEVLQTPDLVGVRVVGLSDATAVMIHRRDASDAVRRAADLASELARAVIDVPSPEPAHG